MSLYANWKRVALREKTKCCGTIHLVRSSGQFDKRKKGKWICACGTIHPEPKREDIY